MTFWEAAAEVLRLVGKPLHYKDITEIAIAKNLLSHVGKNPEVTMGSRLAAQLKKGPKENPLVRIKPGVFALRTWEESGPPGPAEDADLSSLPKSAQPTAKEKKAHERAAQARAEQAAAAEAAVEAEAVEELEEEEALEEQAEELAEEEAHVVEAAAEVVAAGIARVERTPEAEPSGEAETFAETEDETAQLPRAAALSAAPSEGEVQVATAPPALAAAPPAVTPAPPAATPSPSRVRPAAPSRPVAELDSEPQADELLRADLAAGAIEIFGEEEDDDQPILGGDTGPESGGRRRRRRRRGRGGEARGGDEGLPSYTVSPAFGDTVARSEERPSGEVARAEEGQRREEGEGRREERPREERRGEERREERRGEERRGEERREERRGEERREREERQPRVEAAGEGDDVFGREMVDVVLQVLSSFDRNGGAVSLRTLAEAAARRGRLSGDLQALQSQMMAAARADNLRRASVGQRPRFRLQGGRLALTDWGLNQDLLRLEGEALAAVERYRDACRKALARKLTELPPHAFVEVCVTLLERLGMSQLKGVKRPGAGGGEAHLAGVMKGPGAEQRVAVIIRKDGREIGRERVIEVRGAYHHYGPAAQAWLITGGQVLSGAREEAQVPGALPVTLLDGIGLARACEDHGVAVVRAQVPVMVPDLDFFEAVKGS